MSIGAETRRCADGGETWGAGEMGPDVRDTRPCCKLPAARRMVFGAFLKIVSLRFGDVWLICGRSIRPSGVSTSSSRRALDGRELAP